MVLEGGGGRRVFRGLNAAIRIYEKCYVIKSFTVRNLLYKELFYSFNNSSSVLLKFTACLGSSKTVYYFLGNPVAYLTPPLSTYTCK
jgi:hypothetical protein